MKRLAMSVDPAGAYDVNGNPFMTWLTRGNSSQEFNRCLEAVGADELRLRQGVVSNTGRTRKRFTAYRAGRCVTTEVFGTAKL